MYFEHLLCLANITPFRLRINFNKYKFEDRYVCTLNVIAANVSIFNQTLNALDFKKGKELLSEIALRTLGMPLPKIRYDALIGKNISEGSTTEKELLQKFQKYGDVKNIKLNKNHCIIFFKDTENAENAYNKLQEENAPVEYYRTFDKYSYRNGKK